MHFCGILQARSRQCERPVCTSRLWDFRGEALSSIASCDTDGTDHKDQPKQTFGTRYVIEGGKEVSMEDTGAPDGTTFLVRQLFYNVPARRKFLKTPMTEAGHVQDLLDAPIAAVPPGSGDPVL